MLTKEKVYQCKCGATLKEKEVGLLSCDNNECHSEYYVFRGELRCLDDARAGSYYPDN